MTLVCETKDDGGGVPAQSAGATSRYVNEPSFAELTEKILPPPGPVSPTTHKPPDAHVNGTVVVGATVVVVGGGVQGSLCSTKVLSATPLNPANVGLHDDIVSTAGIRTPNELRNRR